MVQARAVVKVSPVIPHLWVNSTTGVLQLEAQTQKLTLKQMVLDGHEAISGSQYVPQQDPIARHVPSRPPPQVHSGQGTGSWQSLTAQIETKLGGMGDEELFRLMTDPAAYSQELHSWLKEISTGKQYSQAHKDCLQAAQSNKDLIAV